MAASGSGSSEFLGEFPLVEVCPVEPPANLGNMSYLGIMPICDAAGETIEWLLHGQGDRGHPGVSKNASYDKNFGSISLQNNRFERAACAMSNYPILYGESGAHNLFIVDQRTQKELDAFLIPQKLGIGWAIGGQFRGPGHERGQKPWYDGIWLYHLLRPDDSEVKCERVTRLVTGEHKGCCELRQKCAGYGEFDGQSPMIWLPGNEPFALFTRANRSTVPPGGFRGVQVARGFIGVERQWLFTAFVQCVFEGVPDNANIYFAHPYHVGNGLAVVFPMELSDGRASGVYMSMAKTVDSDLEQWTRPRLLLASRTFKGRTEDLNVAGAMWNKEDFTVRIMMHRFVHARMNTERATNAPNEKLEWHVFDCQSLFELQPVPKFKAAQAKKQTRTNKILLPAAAPSAAAPSAAAPSAAASSAAASSSAAAPSAKPPSAAPMAKPPVPSAKPPEPSAARHGVAEAAQAAAAAGDPKPM